MIAIILLAIAPLQDPRPAPPLDRAALRHTVDSVMQAERIPGAVIGLLRGDSTILLQAFGVRDIASGAPLRVDDRFMIGSITKQFTAALLVQLVDQQLIQLDAPVRTYLDTARSLPSWADQVTVRQLANHTSGLPRNPINRRNLPNSPSVMLPYSRADLYAGLAQTELKTAPGITWAYSNLGFAVLGEVLARASQQSYDRLLQDQILTPLDMQHSGIHAPAGDDSLFSSGYWPDPFPLTPRPRWNAGEVVSVASMYSTARDLGRFAAILLPQATPVLSSTAQSALLQPTVALPGDDGAQMSLAWFIDPLPRNTRLFGGMGEVDSFSSSLAVAPTSRVTFIILANRGGEAAEALYSALLPLVTPVLAH